ncbi:MAG TPA: hypothetical protein VNR70_10090 [Steroidobacteraceae bacterium]|nr:hypothetical protein [Steroidobacteraceae bacterium]
MKQLRHIGNAAVLLVLGAVSIGGCGSKSTQVANKDDSPQGVTKDSIAQLPDWSGVWVLYLEGGAQEASQDSFGTDNGRVPLTPKYKQLRDAARAARAEDNMANCHPAGVPGIEQHGVLHEYLFTPGRVTVLFEDGELRRIATDGRSHRGLDELTASYMGDSIGHWDGSTLEVDTIGFPYGELFQNYGVRATKSTHMVERIFLKDPDRIEIDTVLTDPQIFTKPYAYTRLYKHSTLPMPESVLCNSRENGETIDLTPPPEG